MKFVHAYGKLRKSRKWLKFKENSENVCRKEDANKSLLKINILVPNKSKDGV